MNPSQQLRGPGRLWLALGLLLGLLGLPRAGQAQLYYALNDGAATTATDQLRTSTLAGAGDAAVKSGAVQSPGALVLDAANSRLLVADARATTASAANTKIVAVSLASGNAATTFLTPAYITGSASTSVTGLALDCANNYLYYVLNDGNATTSTDQLRRVALNGTGDVLLKTGFAQSPGALVLDAANNRLLVADTRATTSAVANTKIVAVSLASGNAAGTFFTPTYLTGSTSTTVAGLALDAVNNYLYYVLSDGNAATSTDQLRRIGLGGTGDALVKNGFAQAPSALVLDAASNRLLVADKRATSASAANTKIVAVSLASGNAVSTLLTPAYLAGSASTTVAGLTTSTVVPPTVTTATPASITSNRAVLGGSVTADGGDAITERGVVYSTTNQVPTTSDTKDINATGTSPFSKTITGLTSAAIYYVRAYATNSAGTGYGAAVSFTTLDPVSGTTVVTNVSCFGGSNGTINLTPRGGVGPYTFLWNSGATTEDRTGLAASTSYSVTITDATGATGAVNNIVITQPLVISGSTSQTNIACNGGATGAASVSPTGGTSPYTYRWSTGATTQTITGLAAGTYTVTITDANGCTATRNFTITQLQAISLANGSQTDVTTTGGSNGSASVTPSGGAGSYTYAWTNNSSTTSTASNLSAGTYTVTVTDANGCTARRTFTITQPTAAPVVTAPSNGSTVGTTTPAYAGTAPASSTVQVYVDGVALPTTTAATAGGTWTISQPTAIGQGQHTVYATAISSGLGQSANSGTITFTVDTGQPAVAISSTAGASGSTTATSPIPFTVTFSESVTGFVAGDLTVTNGTISGFSGSGTTYTFNVAPTTAGTATTVSVPANVAQDGAGNFNTAASQYGITYQQPVAATAQNVTINLAANGTATLSASSVNNGSTGSGTLTYTIQKIALKRVSEGSTLTLSTPNGAAFTQIRFASYGTPGDDGNGNYSANGGCNAANSVATAQNSFVGRSSGSMDAANGPSAANNSPQLGDPCGGIVKQLAVQAAYSANAASLTYACTEASKTNYVLLTVTDGNGNTSTSVAQVTVNPAPTATLTSLSPNPATPGAVVTVSGTNLSGVDSGSVTLNGATLTPSSISASSFQVTLPGNATSGSLAVSLPCGQTLTQALTVTQPTAAPTLSASGNIVNGQPTLSGAAPANSAIVITISQGSTTVQTITGVTATSGGSYSYTVPQGSQLVIGSYTATATAQSSGSSVSATSNQIAFTVPATGPATAISSAAPNPTAASPIPVTVTFSRNVFGFDATDVAVANSGGTASIANFTATSGKVYTFDVVPSASGLVTVNVPAGAAQDSLSRNNQVATQFSRQYNQPATAAPVITLPANNTFTNQAVTISGTAPANSEVVLYLSQNGGAPKPVTVTATAAGAFSIGPLPFPTATYQVYATAQSQGASVSANSATITFTIDQTQPSVAISSTAGASGSTTATSPIPFTVTFSESVTGFVAGDLTVGNGTISGFSGSGTTYTFNVTPTTAGTATTVDVPANVAQDQASNFNTAAAGAYSLTFQAPLIAVAPASLPGSTVGTAYSATLTASGGSGTYTYAITSGALPNGLTLTGSTISGTPTASGTFNFRVTATDNSAAPGPYSGFRDYSLTVTAPTIVVAPASLPNGTQAVAYSATLTASGGASAYTYAIIGGALPNGLTLTGNAISGTPTVNGTFNFTVTATDAFGSAGARAYSLVIAAPAVTAVAWNGSISTDWFTANNWTPNTVPTVTIDATIPTAPSGGLFPAIGAGTGTARNLTLNSGATLSQSGGTLVLAANLTNNGTFQPTGGTVSLGSTAPSSLLGSSNTRFWNLTVGASGAQSSTSASTSVQRLLTLNGNFTTNNNPLTLESNASSTALVVNNGTSAISGPVTVQRYISPSLNANLGYRHVSSPIGNATVASLATGSFAPVVNPAYNSSATPGQVQPFPTVYGYDQSRLATATNNLAAFDKGWYSPAALSDALAVGQGYTTLLSANQTWSFVGTANNGTLPLPLTRNSGATAADAGLQLVGNPYPAPLDWSRVVQDGLSNVDGIMYVFASNDPANPYAGNYGFYQGGFGTISPVLPLGQGFFVRVTQGQTSGTLTLKNPHRVTGYTNPTFQRTAETRPAVHLSLQGAGSPLTDDAFVYFEAGAGDGYQAQYDGEKLANPSGLNLSSSLSATQRLCVNGLEPLGTSQKVVPLAVGVPAVGSYTLRAAEVLNLSTTPVYLRDLQTGALIDLAQQPSYQFTVSNAAALLTGRFELVFSPQQPLATVPAALAQQVALYPNPATGRAFVELPASLGRQAVTATLVDALGREVQTLSLPAQGAAAHPLDLRALPTGVYALRLRTSAGTIVKRLTVE